MTKKLLKSFMSPNHRAIQLAISQGAVNAVLAHTPTAVATYKQPDPKQNLLADIRKKEAELKRAVRAERNLQNKKGFK